MTRDNESNVARNILTNSGVQELLDLDNLTEVAINEPCMIWFDRGNGWESKSEPRLTFHACENLAKALAVYSGITTTFEEIPVASVTLPDGERGQVCVPPVTQKGVVSMTFRKPSMERFTLNDYQKTGRFSGFGEVQAREVTLAFKKSC